MSEELERLYDSALKLPQNARAPFLADAPVSSETIRAEALSLIAATERAEHFFAKLGDVVVSPPILTEVIDDAVGSDGVSSLSPARLIEPDVLKEGFVIGRYTIIGRLGRGGMGTVYRARDTRLDREVALKFLYQHVRGDVDAEGRLLAEARAAAGLHHPNICVVHEIGETPDGQPFIAMELCEGDTLKERIAKGPISSHEAVAIAMQVSRALTAAHARHIIHRDVKPGNIILESGGTVKLLDFGLARSSDVSVTHTGSTPGTVAYMSPEQIRGEALDHRSDLWSLGIVLYEMLAGKRPFRGGSDRVILQGILHEDPEPLQNVRADIPAHVASVVQQLLLKDREPRYAGAAEVLTALAGTNSEDSGRRSSVTRHRRNATVVAAVAALAVALVSAIVWSGKGVNAAGASVDVVKRAEPSIAVLPLVNLSGDSIDAAIAVGITEDLIATLARAGGVRVIASTSTSGFRDRKMDVRQIAESLGVSNILEGGIQKSGSQMRVELRLIAGGDGSTLWSQSYDREFKDIFAVQGEIVRAVAGELGLRFDKNRQLRRHKTRSIVAYELYLRGWDPLLLRTEGGVWKSLEYFQQAIAADSMYAAAHAGLALAQVRRGRTADPGMPIREVFVLAENSARKAVALDDSLPEAHFALSRAMEAKLDFALAEREIRRAIALDPTRSIYHRALGSLHGWANRPKEELAHARRALATDPLNPYPHVAVAAALATNDRCEEALAQLGRIAAFRPPLKAIAVITAQCYSKQRRLPEAIAVLRPQAEGGDPLSQGFLGYMLAEAGQRDEANRVLTDLIAQRERTGVGSFEIAVVHAGLGNLDQAFAWLDRSVGDRSINNVIMAPTFEVLHQDARFDKLKARLGFGSR